MNFSADLLISTKTVQLYYFKGHVSAGAKWKLSGIYSISLLFHISGGGASVLDDRGRRLRPVLKERNCIWSTENSDETCLVWAEPGEVSFLEIRITKAYLGTLLPDAGLIKNFTGKRLSRRAFAQTSEMKEIIYGLGRVSTRPKSLKKIVYEAKSMEMIAVCLDHILYPTKPPARVQRHKDIAHRAKQEIDQVTGKKTFTIIGLAKRLDTNETTLKKAFKDTYGQTIFSYYTKKKILIAKRSLQSGKSVSQTSLICGYSNIAHFSIAFKRETGISPSLFISKS